MRVSCSVAIVMGLAASAAAESDIEQADKLFAEGLALRDTNLTQSCEKFARSLELNPQALGTLLNVALCDEKLGRIASAFARFSEAHDRAKEANLPEYVKAAQEHIDVLAPELPHVELKFVAAKLPGTKVLIGDRVVPEAKWSERIPVDPGEVIIVVSAPDRVAYETKLLIEKRAVKSVQVPELARSVVKSSQRTLGIITTISGGAAIGTSIVLGLVARSKYRAHDDSCVNRICDSEDHAKLETARTVGLVGTVVGAVGVATVGVGLYLWLRAPKERGERRVTVVPDVSDQHAGLAAVGWF